MPARKPHHAGSPYPVNNLLYLSTKLGFGGDFGPVIHRLAPAEARFIAVAHILEHRVIAFQFGIIVRIRLHIVAASRSAIIAEPIQEELAKDLSLIHI